MSHVRGRYLNHLWLEFPHPLCILVVQCWLLMNEPDENRLNWFEADADGIFQGYKVDIFHPNLLPLLLLDSKLPNLHLHKLISCHLPSWALWHVSKGSWQPSGWVMCPLRGQSKRWSRVELQLRRCVRPRVNLIVERAALRCPSVAGCCFYSSLARSTTAATVLSEMVKYS